MQFFNETNDFLAESSSLETLSDDLFFEIFDYLDGSQLNEAFSNLNIRFDNLLNVVLFRTKINLFDSISQNHRSFHSVNIPYKHRTVSLNITGFWDRLKTFSDLSFDSSFSHLQCLQLHDIQADDVLIILSELKHLLRLRSLTISYLYDLGTINQVYQLIFSLPQLKYNKLSIQYSETIEPMSRATFNQLTSIEHLVISHAYTDDQLSALISYTPFLRHLHRENLIMSIMK